MRRIAAWLADDLIASDASSLAYLELQRNRLLRQALREIGGTDPLAAYGLVSDPALSETQQMIAVSVP